MLMISCPNCNTHFEDDTPALEDGADFSCPHCESEISVTLTWESPDPKKAA